MSDVKIEKVRNEQAGERLRALTQDAIQQIERRAFNLFLSRGGEGGREVEDWLQAEREILWNAPIELVEQEKEFRLSVVVAGFDAKDIQITATPGTVVLRAETENRSASAGAVRISEFGERKLFRRIDLPAPIDTEKLTATLDKGILRIDLRKTGAQKERAASSAG